MTRPAFARIAFSRLLLAASLAFGVSAAIAAELPAQLKPAAYVDGDVIRLGDLWDNLGDKANVVIAAAPQPGKRITLESRWLMAAANGHGIDWRPSSVFEKAIVERAGQTVDVAVIERELREALTLEGAPMNSRVELMGRNALQIVVAAGMPATVGVRDVVYDQRMNRFSATVEVPAGSPAATRVKVGGHVYASARIPVLTHTMGRGELITEKDVQWQDVREEQVRRDIIANPKGLIGMEPRYQLRAFAPVRTAEVQRPLMVNRNSSVTMTYRTPFMTLTTQGKALEDGSAGDTIRILNIHSKQTVEARIEGPGLVSVSVGGSRQLAN
jgi:flagella basal body P-ring formation protein FlgA